MSPLNITQPLGIWSIMATIRWCPIFPKWDSYQPLVYICLLQMIQWRFDHWDRPLTLRKLAASNFFSTRSLESVKQIPCLCTAPLLSNIANCIADYNSSHLKPREAKCLGLVQPLPSTISSCCRSGRWVPGMARAEPWTLGCALCGSILRKLGGRAWRGSVLPCVAVASFTTQVVTLRHYRKYSIFWYNLNLMQFAVKGFSWDLVGVGVAHCLHHMQKSQPRQPRQIRLGHGVLWFKADHGKQASAARQWCSVPMAWAFLQMMAVRPGAKMGWWGAVSLPSIKSLFVWCVCVCII